MAPSLANNSGKTISGKLRTRLNTIGVIVLVLSFGIAGIVYRVGQARAARLAQAQAAYAAMGEWTDQSIPLPDSKRFKHDVELYSGKLGLLTIDLQDKLQQPGPQAILIASISILIALGCFLVARRLPNGEASKE